MPVLALGEARAFEMVDIAIPQSDAETGVGVEGRLATATTENFMAGLEALNQAMVIDDGESVAA